MSSPSNVDRGHSKKRRREKPYSRGTGSTHRSASILNNASNNQFQHNVFTTNTTNISASASSLDLLYNSVAPNAILNSGGRADEVRCYPGTREEVIGLVKKSITQQYTEPRMLWLSGPAGAGKSAIMQTVAEQCRKEGVPHASFFFFRADGSRKNSRPFVATIMHQIIQRYPSMEPAVAAALTSNPLLFQMAIQDQFDVLLHQVASTIHDASPSLPPLVLLIDGLDECDSEHKSEQRQLLQALDTLLAEKGLHFRVIVASRVEPQISMAFSQLRSRVDSIFLDEKYSPEKDIHRFVTAEFAKIKSSHYLGSTLGPEWPSESDIAGIVAKSSGQFIFAATVMRFIACSPASPMLSLKKVQGIVPPSKNSPFAQLDAVYAYILGQVEDWEAAKVLFSIRLLDSVFNDDIPELMVAYQPRFSRDVFDSCLSELAALVYMKDHALELFHASLTDFLHDKTRSRDYHIDLEQFRLAAVPFWWRNQSIVSVAALCMIIHRIKQPTPVITAAFMEHTPVTPNIVHFVRKLEGFYSHEPQTFISIIRLWTSRNPKLVEDLPESLRKYAPSESLSSVSPSASQISPSTANIPQPLLDRRKHLSTPKLHSPTAQTHSSTSLPNQSASLMRPCTPQTYPPMSRMHPSTHQTHQHNHQISSYIHQPHYSTYRAPPPTPWTHPSAFQTRPSTFQTSASNTRIDPFIHQIPPPTDQIHPFIRQEHSSSYEMNPSGAWTYPFIGQTHASIPTMLPPVSQTHQLHHQMRLSNDQAHPFVFQTPPPTFSHQSSSQPHPPTSQMYSSDAQKKPYVSQTPQSTDQAQLYGPSTFTYPHR